MQNNSELIEKLDVEDFDDALHQRKKRRRIEKCFVCKLRIDKKELFRPCNCEFSYIHYECLQRWMQEKHNCRICKHDYDILNKPNTCGICRQIVRTEENVRSCNCRFRKHHQLCIQKQVESGERKCRYCMQDFAINQTVSWRLTFKHLQKAFCFMCKALKVFMIILYVLFWIAVILFTVAPENLIYLRFSVLECFSGGFVLFPGYAEFPVWLDVVYLILTAILYFLTFAYILADQFESNYHFRNLWALTPALIPMVLIHQLFGNIHYHIYCAASVIPMINCRWMMNLQSFFAGATIIYPPTVLYLLFICFRFMCCKKVVTTTVVDLEKGLEH